MPPWARFTQQAEADDPDRIGRHALALTLAVTALTVGPFSILVAVMSGSWLAGIGFHLVIVIPAWLWARRLFAQEREALGLPPLSRRIRSSGGA